MRRDSVLEEAFPLPEVDSRGVDLSQIRDLLGLTVSQRLDHLEAAQASLMELRHAFSCTTEEHSTSTR